MAELPSYVRPHESFAMSSLEFVPHITLILEQLGLPLQARTNFIKYVSVHFEIKHGYEIVYRQQ